MDPDQPGSQLQPDLNPYHQQRTRTDPSSHVWGASRIGLTSLSVSCCAIVLGISIALAANPAVKSYIIVWTAPQAGASLVWSGIELITACVRRQSPRSIHPGAYVAVHLLLWLGFGVGVGLTAYMLAFALVFVGSDDRNGYFEYDRYYYDEDGREYYSDYYIRSMEVLVAFLALLIFIHICLFARACVEMARRRRIRNAQRQADYPMEPWDSARSPEKNKEQKETRRGAR
ncbi:hypothetical protein F5Y06DRAFT_158740 [Hypoxylon sp. FL0890]|nr:hypothetical protein F5Y06DRAFT_158740 [Hypoxylon sp. FL0890]